MLDSIRRAVTTPDLRTKFLITIGLLVIYRAASFIPAPGVNPANVQACLDMGGASGGIYDLVNLFSGGALLSVSIVALGVMPFITASIIMQLLKVVVPRIAQLGTEGPEGQATLAQYTRYLSVLLSLVNASTVVSMASTGTLLGNCPLPIVAEGTMTRVVMVAALTAGAVGVMWMGEKITERGIGNGMSLLIFVSIAAGFPTSLGTIAKTQGWMTFTAVMAVGIMLIAAVVFVEQSQRRVPVIYSRRSEGGRLIEGSRSFLPLKVNMAGVVPVIFASSMLMMPTMVSQFAVRDDGTSPDWAVWITRYLSGGDHPVYMVSYFLLITFFTFFYVAITFDTHETAENMKTAGGFIPGIRPGKPTAQYLSYVSTRITAAGALYLGILATIPVVALVLIGADQNFPFGGAALLIIVGVGLDTVKQINAQMEQRSYSSLMR